ncbi:MAG UNVERIFIED_CONTAM: hypothetical protein LOD86_03430 [Thermobifida fusca]
MTDQQESLTHGDETESAVPAISPDEYSAFIQQIELQDIWLREARVTNNLGPQTPEQSTLKFEVDATWEPLPGGFRALHRYRVLFETTDELLAEIDVTFGVDFTSDIPMTDEIFAIFQDVNLPVNTWPYLREFVATVMSRMGWAIFTIPAFKTGITSPGGTRRT